MSNPQAEIIPQNVDLYAFDDIPHWRQDLFDKTIQGLEKSFPRDYGNVTMELSDLNYKPKVFTPEDEKKARMEKRTLAVPVKGTVTLRDKESGDVLDQAPNKTVLSVPYLTDRGTFVHNGSNYTSMRQARLLPGAYARRRNNGQLEVHYNVKPGSGRAFRVTFDPESTIFRMEVGGSNLKLYSVLKSLGIDDKQLEERWGKDVYAANAATYDRRDANKLFSKLYPYDDETVDEDRRREMIREALEGNIVLGSTLESTLGSNFRKRASVADRIKKMLKIAAPKARMELEDDDEQYLTIDDILGSSEKLIAINRGEAEPDDRDALQYKRVYNPGDMIAERIKIDADKTARTLLRKLSRKKSLEHLPGNFLNRYTEGQLVGNSMSTPGEETNPVLLYEQLYRITAMGPGGIGSESAITEEQQNVSPSGFGFIDPVSGPECFHKNMSVFTTKGWKKWPEVDDEDLLLTTDPDNPTTLIYEKPSRIVREQYAGDLLGLKTKFISQAVTPNHRVLFKRHGCKTAKIRQAHELFKKSQFNLITGNGAVLNPEGSVEEFQIPLVERSKNHTGLQCGSVGNFKPIPLLPWLEFLGFYLSEGSCYANLKRKNYTVKISQSRIANPDVCNRIEQVLDGCGFHWCYTKGGDYAVSSKALVKYLEQFGLCYDKFIPDYVFEASIEARKAFIDCMMLGDGRVNKTHYAYTTTSKKLADDFERLCVEMGLAVNRSVEVDNREERYRDCYIVSIHKYKERAIVPKQHFKVPYNDKVYCATVRSGLLFVRGETGIGFWSGNSGRAGIDVRATQTSRLGSDGRIYQKFFNPRLNRYEWLNARDLRGKSLAFKD